MPLLNHSSRIVRSCFAGPLLDDGNRLADLAGGLEITQQHDPIGQVARVDGRRYGAAENTVLSQEQQRRHLPLTKKGQELVQMLREKLLAGHGIEITVETIDDDDAALVVVRRIIVIDSLNGYLNAMPSEPGAAFARAVELPQSTEHDDTLLMTRRVLSAAPYLRPLTQVALAEDTVLLLRYFEAAGEIRQAISVIKKRTRRSTSARFVNCGSTGAWSWVSPCGKKRGSRWQPADHPARRGNAGTCKQLTQNGCWCSPLHGRTTDRTILSTACYVSCATDSMTCSVNGHSERALLLSRQNPLAARTRNNSLQFSRTSPPWSDVPIVLLSLRARIPQSRCGRWSGWGTLTWNDRCASRHSSVRCTLGPDGVRINCATRYRRRRSWPASCNDNAMPANPEGIITSWNAGAERLFGYSPEEAVGQPITIIIPRIGTTKNAWMLEKLRKGERLPQHGDSTRIQAW